MHLFLQSQKLTMPRVDGGNAHIRSLPERVCKIKLPSSDQLQKTRYNSNYAMLNNIHYKY